MIALVAALLQDRPAEAAVGRLALLASGSSALFGAAVGAYVGGYQVLTNVVKMPVFFLGTLALSFGAMHLFAARAHPARETFVAAVETIAVTALVLGALAPIVALVALSSPVGSGGTYRFVVLILTLSVAAAGVCGVTRLHARLRSFRLTAVWIVIYQFVGAQMAWLLKPWVGHTGTDDRFLPLAENMQGNFYEAVFNVLVNLLT